MSKNNYIWKLVRRKWYFIFDDLEEFDYFNIPCCRRKSGYRSLLRAKAKIKEYKKDYKIKFRSSKWIMERDPYEDSFAQAWLERKNWKRNSSRKHQWKDNL